jgi:ABC-2 type transport system permease protein
MTTEREQSRSPAATLARASRSQAGMPSVWRLGWSRTVIDLKQFVRIPEQVFFTFALPILFLGIFSAVFSGDIVDAPDRELRFVQYFLPGIIALGVASSTFANLAMSISVERHEGLLKRLAGTPLPKRAFFLGRVASSVVITAVQTLLLLAIGVLLFGVDLPESGPRWLMFGYVLVVSAALGAGLGIAMTRLVPNARAAAPIVQAPFLVLQFISGVFFQWEDLPGWLQAIASAFPLRWMAQGFRYAFLPDWFGEGEYGAAWGWEYPAAILAGWLVIATVLALVFFRWDQEADR